MYQLPTLNYSYDAFGQYISKDIMELHHSKHHQAYIDKLNAALDTAPQLKEWTLEELLIRLNDVPQEVQTIIRNHGGGHFNHSLFWQWLSPETGSVPAGELAAQLGAKYGSYQAFVDAFSAQALSVFGSGWVWLQPNLEIITTANQNNPIMDGKPAPLLGLDVWEHAYYLDYKNKRDDYVKAWWNVVNWGYVDERFAAASRPTAGNTIN